MATVTNLVNQTQHFNGTTDNDVFVVEGNYSDFGWGKTEDGTGIVIWQGAQFDVLHNVEEIQFHDFTLKLNEVGEYKLEERSTINTSATRSEVTPASTKDNNIVQNQSNAVDYVFGTSDYDVFSMGASSADYGWGSTLDGNGLVIWSGDEFDIVYNVEEVQFDDLTLVRQDDGSYAAKEASVNSDTQETGSESDLDSESATSDVESGSDNSLVASITVNSDTGNEDLPSDADITETTESSNESPSDVNNEDLTDAQDDVEVKVESEETSSDSNESSEETNDTGLDRENEKTDSVPVETAPISYSLVDVNGNSTGGSNTLLEGGTVTYRVKTDRPVTEDTWVTVRVNEGSAKQDDGTASRDHDGVLQFFQNQTVKDNYYQAIEDNPGVWGAVSKNISNFSEVPVGTENLNADYYIGKGTYLARNPLLSRDNGIIYDTNEVKLLIKAGSTGSEAVSIRANWETHTGNKVFNKTLASERNETFSVELVGISQSDSTQLNQQGTPDDAEITQVPGDGDQIITTTIIDRTSTMSPIAIDLSGDDSIGVTGETSSYMKDNSSEIGRTVEFDIDADGELDTIEWFDGSGDGILIDNRDGNAADSMDGSRLFGDESGKYTNGYEKLALLDENGDGQLSGSELEGLELWLDDGDAIVEDGELQSLSDHEIIEISVIAQDAQDDEGRTLIQSTAKTVDGNVLLTEDVWFAQAETPIFSNEANGEDQAVSYNMEMRFIETDFAA